MSAEHPPDTLKSDFPKEESIKFWQKRKIAGYVVSAVFFAVGTALVGLRIANVLPDIESNNQPEGAISFAATIGSLGLAASALLIGYTAGRFQRSLEGPDPNISWERLHEPQI